MEDEQRLILRDYLSFPDLPRGERERVKSELTTPFALQRMTAIVLGVHSIIPNGDLKTVKLAEDFILQNIDLCTHRELTTDQAAMALCALDSKEYMGIGASNTAYRYYLTLNEIESKRGKLKADGPFPMTELRLRFINYEKVKKRLMWVTGALLTDPAYTFRLKPQDSEALALKGYAIMDVTPPDKRPTLYGVMEIESQRPLPRQPLLFACPYNENAGLRPDGKKKRCRPVIDHTA